MRSPDVTDAAAMHRLVREDGGLDLNSVYCYLLICSHFAGTSLVAEGQAGLAGFVAAYRQPAQPETLFVWQIGVAAGRRRQGIGRRLLRALWALPACRGARFLEATVTPSNLASRGLFVEFAREREAAFRTEPGFSGELFGAAPVGERPHEPEERFRIGPLREAETVGQEGNEP